MKELTRTPFTRRVAATAAAGLALAIGLVGCSSNSGSGSAASSTTYTQSDVTAALTKGGSLTYWTWAAGPAQDQIKAFEKAYPKVKVNIVNPGTGTTAYTKLQNAIKAGKGAPDVSQIEYYALPQFALGNALVNLSDYGLNSLKSKFSAGPWGSVNIGGKLLALPQDSGPMGLFYNKKVFDQYGLTVPTTWAQYAADAKKLHAANPKDYIAADSGDPGFVTSMIWQAGGHPFAVNGTNIGINLQDAGTKSFTSMWGPLVSGGLVSPTVAWSNDWYTGLGNGTIASLVTGAWMPTDLEGSVPQASGNWRVAPMPTYNGQPATAENGGSSVAVLQQSKNKLLAAGFVEWLNSSDTSTQIFMKDGGFPSTTALLTSSSFLSQAPTYFGGQQINKVLAQSANNVVSGWQYLPFEVYANSIFNDTVGKAYTSNSSLDSGLTAWQQQLVSYGNQQGYKVTGK